MTAAKSPYLQSQTFFDLDIRGAHERIGELLAQGVTQITLAVENGEVTLSWPVRHVPSLTPEAAA